MARQSEKLAMSSASRRGVLSGAATLAFSLAAPCVIGQARPQAVIIGGGFGGATCARYLNRLGVAVTLLEPNATYVACPFSNLVIHGSRDLASQQFGYEALKREGIVIVPEMAAGVDADARLVRLASGMGAWSSCPFPPIPIAARPAPMSAPA